MYKLIIVLMVLLGVVLARPTSTQNILLGALPYGNCTTPSALTDGDKGTISRVWGKVTVGLPYPLYIGSIQLTFNSAITSTNSVIVERFIDDKSLEQVFQRKELSADKKVLTVYGDNLAAKVLRFSFVSPSVLAEIEVFPSMDVWPEAWPVTPAIITDTEILLSFDTNVELKGTLLVKDEASQLRALPTLFYTKQHRYFVHELRPASTYVAGFSFMDLHANINNSSLLTLKTQPSNLAQKALVSGTFIVQPTQDAYVVQVAEPLQRLTDGSDSYFDSLVTSGDPDKAEQYVIVDLGEPQPVQYLVIYWRALAYSKDYNVSISEDGNTWQDVAVKNSAANGFAVYSRTGDPLLLMKHELDNVRARYLKITIPQGSEYFVADKTWNWVQMMEIKAF
jgi:hypothetical protein